jgi:hypothetical protein
LTKHLEAKNAMVLNQKRSGNLQDQLDSVGSFKGTTNSQMTDVATETDQYQTKFTQKSKVFEVQPSSNNFIEVKNSNVQLDEL